MRAAHHGSQKIKQFWRADADGAGDHGDHLAHRGGLRARYFGRAPKERDLAYTTVSSVVRTLEKKDFVQARKRGRTHLYSPIVSRTRYAAGKLRSLVAGVFQGRPEELVRALVDESEMSAQELQEIAEIIHQEKSK